MLPSTYRTAADTDGIENLTKRLAADFRASVRSLTLAPFMSPEWFKASSTLAHMASVAEMVRADPGGV